MGCFCSHPLVDVINDPTVTKYASVGDISIVRGNSRTAIMARGMMYIKAAEGMLYYCASYGCGSFRHSFVLAEISRIEVLSDQHVYQGHSYLNSTLRIYLGVPSKGLLTTVTVAMPDAQEFAAELSKLTNIQVTASSGSAGRALGNIIMF